MRYNLAKLLCNITNCEYIENNDESGVIINDFGDFISKIISNAEMLVDSDFQALFQKLDLNFKDGVLY